MIRRGLISARRLAVRRALFAQPKIVPVLARSMSVTTRVQLPSHELVPLPALSPTMEVGTIKSWEVRNKNYFIFSIGFLLFLNVNCSKLEPLPSLLKGGLLLYILLLFLSDLLYLY